MISDLLYVSKPALQPRVWSVFCPAVLEEREAFCICVYSVLYVLIRSCLSAMLFTSHVFSLIFVVLFYQLRREAQSTNTIMDFSASPCISDNFCFIYFEARLLDVFKFRIAVQFWCIEFLIV